MDGQVSTVGRQLWGVRDSVPLTRVTAVGGVAGLMVILFADLRFAPAAGFAMVARGLFWVGRSVVRLWHWEDEDSVRSGHEAHLRRTTGLGVRRERALPDIG
ncbi:hypothetical protein [Nocardiopsis salina]|uniref:hypothetical protein n=1 Tax=Nocardiopsis salina TaxID=245836 RepID=UPI00034C31D8|nr:hypothetical protein [Nocardiopsis salina]